MRLIDADAFIDDLYEHEFSNWCDKDEVSTLVYDAPTIEPKRGEWILSSDGNGYIGNPVYKCTVCGWWDEEVPYNFCPNCGARMKGASNGTDVD